MGTCGSSGSIFIQQQQQKKKKKEHSHNGNDKNACHCNSIRTSIYKYPCTPKVQCAISGCQPRRQSEIIIIIIIEYDIRIMIWTEANSAFFKPGMEKNLRLAPLPHSHGKQSALSLAQPPYTFLFCSYRIHIITYIYEYEYAIWMCTKMLSHRHTHTNRICVNSKRLGRKQWPITLSLLWLWCSWWWW